MKRIAICWMFISITLVGVAFGQNSQGKGKRRVVIVPPHIILPVVASQPDSPLQIEDLKVFMAVSGGNISYSYKVRNRGATPIRSYTIGASNTAGTGWEVGPRPLEENLLPGQVATLAGNEVEVIELTEDLRNQLELRGEMQAIMVLMVVGVEYWDGSAYKSEPLYKALQAHLEKISP
ncbi:MAG TPA: hypothetical protein VFH31_19055 [Pyrinomonadaceae bacterium]|nr:hypothetical protein [Pyrinomonadaceae bacterium]